MKEILFVFIMTISYLHCEAQNKSFILSGLTDIKKNGTQILPWGKHYIEFELNDNALIIRFPTEIAQIEAIKMSKKDIKVIYQELTDSVIMYTIYNNTDRNSFAYLKHTKCSSNFPCKSFFSIRLNDDQYFWSEGVMLYTYKNNTSNYTDYDLCYQSIEEDAFIKFIKSLRTTATNENERSTSAPDYGEIKFSGYTYHWNDFYRKSSESDNGSLTIETSPNHYIGVTHDFTVTNLSPNHKSKVKWSTRNGAIKVSLPKGVRISDNDEIICWEENGSSTYADYREVVLFIWNSSSNNLQCIRTTRRLGQGRILNDVDFFRTTDSSAWFKIKPKILYELPFCGTQIQ